MNKKLYLMSELLLRSFCDSSNWLKDSAVGMSAKDVELNTNLILESAEINEIPSDGIVKLNIDDDGIAHIPVTGFLTRTHVTPSAAFETKAVTTFNFIIESSRLVDENERVKETFFEFNTGGGNVDGSEAAAIAIANIKKPTTARVHSNAESAGILLASQADRIVAVGKMSMLGSIGVVAEFKDRSKAEEAEGTKSIILTSNDAPEKRVDITTDKGQKSVIKLMDEIHLAMADMIAKGRGVSLDFVNKNFGKGGTMTAERALQVGLIDEIESLQMSGHKKKKTLKSNSDNSIQTSTTTIPKTQTPPQPNEETMTLTEFLAQNAEAKTEHDNMLATAKTEAKAELKTELKALSEKVKPIMASGAYKQRIKTAGFEVMTGERTKQSFMDMVAVVDENNEGDKSDQIKADQPDPTLADDDQNKDALAKGQTQANAKALSEEINTTNKVT